VFFCPLPKSVDRYITSASFPGSPFSLAVRSPSRRAKNPRQRLLDSSRGPLSFLPLFPLFFFSFFEIDKISPFVLLGHGTLQKDSGVPGSAKASVRFFSPPPPPFFPPLRYVLRLSPGLSVSPLMFFSGVTGSSSKLYSSTALLFRW